MRNAAGKPRILRERGDGLESGAMTPDDIVLRIRARLARTLAPPSSALTPLEVHGEVAGRLTPSRARRAVEFSDVFQKRGDALEFAPGLNDAAARSAALSDVTRILAAEGALTAWRNERYAVAAAYGAPPWFELERAAARYFGVHTYAAHVNGLVRDTGSVKMWLARRSATKAIDPGMLDNLVGGGIAADLSVADTVVKEAWEEAGIDAGLAAAALPAGTLEIFREQRDGIQRETIFVHDLWLQRDFMPRNQDGEAVAHRLASLDEVAGLLAIDEGGDAVTVDASLVAFDCLMRIRSGAPL